MEASDKMGRPIDYFEFFEDEQEKLIKEGVDALEEFQKNIPNVIEAYFNQYGPATQTIESFNHFMKHSVPEIVLRCGYVEHQEIFDPHSLTTRLHRVKATKVQIESNIVKREKDGIMKILYPNEARMRNLQYVKMLYAEVSHKIYNVDAAGHKKVFKSVKEVVNLGEIPIMVKSEHCSLHGLSDADLMYLDEDPADPGGYFIINGKEKVLISQERAAYNQLFILKPMCDADYQLEAEIRSSANTTTDELSALWIRIPGDPTAQKSGSFSRLEHSATTFYPRASSTGRSSVSHHIRPVPTAGWIFDHKKLLKRKYRNKFPGLLVCHMALMEQIPLKILYKALGFMDDKSLWETLEIPDVYSAMFLDNLGSSLASEEAQAIKTRDEALIFIGKLRKQAASEKYLDRETGARRIYSDEEYLVRGKNFINNEVLPIVGDGDGENDDKLKGYHIGYMVNRLIIAYEGGIPCDDRDHLQNKRFDLAGPLMAVLLKRLVNTLFDDMRVRIKQKIDNKRPYDFFKQIGTSTSLTHGFTYAFSSGNWGDKRKSSTVRTGVVQPLNRVTRVATLAFLRRINSPVSRLVRMTDPRLVPNSGFGYICPSDTPEGEPVGLLKNLAVMAHVSVECDQGPVLQCLEEHQYQPIEEDFKSFCLDTKIILNERLIGSFPNAICLVDKLKQRRSEWDEAKYQDNQIKKWKEILNRRNQERSQGLPVGTIEQNDNDHEEFKGISNQISVTKFGGEIRIRTDSGRPMRPLFVVQNNKVKLKKHHIERLRNPDDNYSWADLVKDRIIEFLDASEEETAMIAMFPQKLIASTRASATNIKEYQIKTYTHCEINPTAIMGVCASLIPFADHNQSPRVTYQSNMAKQAIGIYTLNYKYRYDADMHVLNYPQRPLVTTQSAKFSRYDEFPSGINATVAIMSMLYNQEDSVVMNTSAIQRGLFRSTHFKTKTDEARTHKELGDADEMFERPNPHEITSRRVLKYETLDMDGFPYVGNRIEDGYPIIGKTQMVSKSTRTQQEIMGRMCPKKQDVSELYKISSASQPGVIDSVLVTENNDGYRMVKVRVRTPRIPQMGDKFASRHGQKGVMGLEMHEADLPFTKDGIVPDLMLNPHAIPSRMTIGHLKEMWYANYAAGKGTITDGTCFTKRPNLKELEHLLEFIGFQMHGNETMYLGSTGRKINVKVFFGPCYYQRLKHMTEDKLHFRARGPVTTLCKQPNSGLQREGGLRFGEMERDSCITHGGAQFLRERLLLVSDYYTLPICKKCGQILVQLSDPRPGHKGKKFNKCNFCGTSRVGGITIELPYACKLLFQELGCMNVKVMLSAEETGSKMKGAKKAIERKANVIDEILNNQQIVQEWSRYDTEMRNDRIETPRQLVPAAPARSHGTRSPISLMLKFVPPILSCDTG